MSLLDDKVRSRIRELLRGFEEWLRSEDAKAAIQDRSVKLREVLSSWYYLTCCPDDVTHCCDYEMFL
jgi:hypothetical protein